MSNKRRGGFSEAIFTAICQYKHIHVAAPMVPERYDFVMRLDRRWSTVQVKSLAHSKTARSRGNVIVQRTSDKPYDPGDFDYLCIVNQNNLDAWLIPEHELTPRASISPYMDRWTPFTWHSGPFDPEVPVRNR